MWVQYKGFDWESQDKYNNNTWEKVNLIYFESSQFTRMKLSIKLNKKDVELFEKQLDYREIYDHFRDLKYNYIRENYPRIYELHNWRKLNYNKTI
jgi:hypothetical protein